MLATVQTAYTDTRADALSFALGLPALDALAVLPLVHGSVAVELRLLGASHQVIAGPVSETVACLPGRPGPLPRQVRRAVGGWAYDFAAEVRGYDATGFETAADEIRARLHARRDALVGTFPGSEYAITALALGSTGGAAIGSAAIAWRTWHAYPQTREIVMTSSRMRATHTTEHARNGERGTVSER